MRRFNDWLALWVTARVATMWCTYFFCLVAVGATPGLLWPAATEVFQWFAQDFSQLVLLPLIMVGTALQATAAARVHESVTDLHDKIDETHSKLDELHQKIDGAA